MSIESALEKLSLADSGSIADAVKADGVAKSGLAANIAGLVAKCASNTDDEALAGLAAAKALADVPEADAFTKECLTACKFLVVYHLCWNCISSTYCSVGAIARTQFSLMGHFFFTNESPWESHLCWYDMRSNEPKFPHIITPNTNNISPSSPFTCNSSIPAE